MAWPSAHTRAFWNSRSQGPGPSLARPSSWGRYGFCHARKQRSGCGMSARWRPSGEHSAAMPSALPLGLKGYASVACPAESVYLRSVINDEDYIEICSTSVSYGVPIRLVCLYVWCAYTYRDRHELSI